MSILNRDVVVVIKFVTSCITAGFLIFFISALTGEDLFKNQESIEELDGLLSEISTELNEGIERSGATPRSGLSVPVPSSEA